LWSGDIIYFEDAMAPAIASGKYKQKSGREDAGNNATVKVQWKGWVHVVGGSILRGSVVRR
jgi:hypothetical protein